eukprot:306400_1
MANSHALYEFVLVNLIILMRCLSLETITFNIETDEISPSLIDEFLSVTLGAGLTRNWTELNFQSVLVNTLAKGLSPTYFRYGGLYEDETIYNTNGNITKSIKLSSSEYTLNMTEFSQLSDFANRNKWKLVFGLNAQQRFSNNTWNPSNSEDLMYKIIESTKDDLIIGYELGNEPDIYYRSNKNFMNVSAKQLSKDFITLYNFF